MARIGITGSQSVGKTTLVNALQKVDQFKNYTFRTERSKYLMSLGIPLNTDSTLKGQTVFLSERVSELINENIITDRTILDVMAFTECSKSMSSVDKKSFSNYAKVFLREYDHIFYISPEGVEIEDNSIRETNSDYRDLIDFTIKNIISSNKHRIKRIHFLPPNLTTEERVLQILHLIQS